MGPNMHGQGAPLDEALAALGLLAGVGSLVRVDPIVPLEVGLPIEALFGEFASG